MTDAAPGWYPAGDELRWWDGQQWTEKTQPLPQHQPTPAPAAQPPSEQVPDGTIWHATGKPLTGMGAGRYRLTDEFLYFEKGGLRTNAQQIPVHDIHDIDANQSMAQKARGVGTITVHVRRPDRTEIVHLEDIPNFREGVHALNNVARAARERIQTRSQTQRIEHTGYAPTPGVPQTPQGGVANPQGEDVFATLEKLGKLRDAGYISADDFETKKAELLSRI